MTEKERERNVLEQIRKLLEPTYYCKTALWDALDYAERNIDDDASYNPVEEINTAYAQNLRKDAEYGQKLLKLEHENNAMAENLKAKDAEIEKLGHICDSQKVRIDELLAERDEWEQNAHDAGELYAELEAECAEKDAEIMRLKAEIYDLRKECGK